MFGFDLERRLRRAFAPPMEMRAEHERELGAELMVRFAEKHPQKERLGMKRFVLRKVVLASAAALILGAAACVAPAEVEVDMGRSLVIQYDDSAAGQPEPEQLIALFHDEEGGTTEVSKRKKKMIWVSKENDLVSVHLELWGDDVPKTSMEAKVKEAFPSLASAKFEEKELHGHVQGTLGKKLGYEFLKLDVLDDDDVETARQKLIAELRNQGIEGQIDVQVDDSGGKRKVKIRVESEECPSPGGEQQ